MNKNIVEIKNINDGEADTEWMTFKNTGNTMAIELKEHMVKRFAQGSFHFEPQEVKELMLLCRRVLKV